MPDYLHHPRRHLFPWSQGLTTQGPPQDDGSLALVQAAAAQTDPRRLFPWGQALVTQGPPPAEFSLQRWMDAAQHPATIAGVSAEDAPIFLVTFVDYGRMFGTATRRGITASISTTS